MEQCIPVWDPDRSRADALSTPTHVLMQTMTADAANMFMALGIDNSWSWENFLKGFQLHINSLDGDTLEFDIIGIDASIANSQRRILISEVPTMAIEHVFFVNNTSIIAVSHEAFETARLLLPNLAARLNIPRLLPKPQGSAASL